MMKFFVFVYFDVMWSILMSCLCQPRFRTMALFFHLQHVIFSVWGLFQLIYPRLVALKCFLSILAHTATRLEFSTELILSKPNANVKATL